MLSELEYKIALTKIPYIGHGTARLLVQHCGGVEAIFHTSKKALAKIPRVSTRIIDAISAADPEALSASEVAFVKRHDIRLLFFTDSDYPERLRPHSDAPMALYYKGNADLNAERTVAIVGTRKPTDYGRQVCEQLVQDLQQYKVTIFSGLAYGIDIAAHQKCLSLQVPTVGVLGHGLDQIYPAAHKETASRMLANGGLLTQFGPGLGPDRVHFPMRNKVVAGLSDLVIVVETARKGGSMITAEMAAGYNKDVFAVPGRIGDKYSKGANHLIKAHKANLVESAQDIAYVMRWEQTETMRQRQTELFAELNEQERQVVQIIGNNDNIHIDQLTFETALSNSQIAALVLELEFKGVVKAMPGKRFALVR